MAIACQVGDTRGGAGAPPERRPAASEAASNRRDPFERADPGPGSLLLLALTGASGARLIREREAFERVLLVRRVVGDELQLGLEGHIAVVGGHGANVGF